MSSRINYSVSKTKATALQFRLLAVGMALALLVAPKATSEQVRVVLEESPPHQVVKDGQISGLSTAVVDAVLKRAGDTPSYEVYPWARAYRIAITTPNVLIYNIARTPEREAQFEWIGKVANYKFGFLKLSKRSDIQVRQLSDLRQYAVGAQRDDFMAEWLRDVAKLPAEHLQLQPDVVETWRLLVNGKIDLMSDDPHAIDDILKKYKLQRSDIEFVLFPPELEVPTWLALKKGSSPDLVRRLRQAYRQVEGSAVHRKVMELSTEPKPL